MKKVLLLSVLMGLVPLSLMAQDDDLYFKPKKKTDVKTEVRTPAPVAESPAYYVGSSRSVDEYNRYGRFRSSYQQIGADGAGNDIIEFTASDGLYPDSSYVDTLFVYPRGGYADEADDYVYTRRMSRFDDFYGWYDPWSYSPYWASTWRYNPWYGTWFRPWYVGYGRYGWYDTWYGPLYSGYYGWGWPYYGYSWGGYYPYYHRGGYAYHRTPTDSRNFSYPRSNGRMGGGTAGVSRGAGASRSGAGAAAGSTYNRNRSLSHGTNGSWSNSSVNRSTVNTPSSTRSMSPGNSSSGSGARFGGGNFGGGGSRGGSGGGHFGGRR